VGDVARPAAVSEVRGGGFRDRRHDLSGHSQAPAAVVRRDVVHHQPEERRQCPGPAACPRTRQLPDGVDAATQAAADDGPTGLGQPAWRVEVDEFYVREREKGVSGRETTTKAIFAVAVEKDGRGFGRARLCRIRDVSADSLLLFVRSTIATGAAIQTDGSSGYAGLAPRRLPAPGHRHQRPAPIQHTSSCRASTKSPRRSSDGS
jgi:hypothetical protein